MTTPEPLRTSPDCLLVFVDDTGNESFRGQPYFGLGGIMLAARENEALLKPRWRALRKIVHGSEDQPLHASELGHAGNSEHIEAAANFFRQNHFLRFGISTHSTVQVPARVTMRQPVYEMLKKYVAQAAAVSRCDSVALIFESSERADAILQSEFGLFDPRQADGQLPVELCLMPKAAKEPALEAADFVANSIGGMARRMIAGRRDFPADFCSIFHSVPSTKLFKSPSEKSSRSAGGTIPTRNLTRASLGIL
jgi:Protein of unknown function (DUF3800)